MIKEDYCKLFQLPIGKKKKKDVVFRTFIKIKKLLILKSINI